jgi:hypothetical protein
MFEDPVCFYLGTDAVGVFYEMVTEPTLVEFIWCLFR